MSLIRITRNPTGRQLRVFAAAWLLALGSAGLAGWMRGRHGAAEALWALAVALPLCSAASPSAVRHAYVGLSYATYPIGWVVSHVVLAVAYYLVLTPIGLAMRLFRHDALARRFEPERKSYWQPTNRTRPVESYFDQT
jgi:Saxitoxin biosynthesis operon protein SxtJ